MTVPMGVDRTCVHCGKVVAKDRQRLCDHCGLPFAAEGDRYEALVAGEPSTIVRTYHGAQQADTAAAFQQDAKGLARFGYTPTTQSWAQGQWGSGAFAAALLLCIVLVGILVFIYMLIVKPDGTLTVTYSKVTSSASAPAQASLPSTAPALAALTLNERLAQLDAARSSERITPEEYDAKRAEVLNNL